MSQSEAIPVCVGAPGVLAAGTEEVVVVLVVALLEVEFP